MENTLPDPIWGNPHNPDPNNEIILHELLEDDLVHEEAPRLDIRHKLFWDNYLDPRMDAFGNAAASAIAAGYSETYSRNITGQRFFKERMRRMNMLSRAEKVLKRTLIMKTEDPTTGKEQADLLRIQVDVAKHITKTLGKDEGYSERTELTAKDGNPIVFMPVEIMDRYNLLEEPKELQNVSENRDKEQEERNESSD